MNPRCLRCALLALLMTTIPALAQNERPHQTDQFQTERPASRRSNATRRQPQQQLDDAKTELRVYQLQHADEGEVANALVRIKPALGPNAQITADVRTHAIVVAASGEAAWKRINDLITSLDVPRQQSVTKIVPLTHLDAGYLSHALIETLRGSSTHVRIVSENTSNTLLLSGTAENVEVVLQLVQELESIKANRDQQQAADTSRLHALTLRHADPVQLCPLIDKALTWLDLPVKVASDRASRQILIYTNEAGLQQVQQLLQQFDVPSVLETTSVQETTSAKESTRVEESKSGKSVAVEELNPRG